MGGMVPGGSGGGGGYGGGGYNTDPMMMGGYDPSMGMGGGGYPDPNMYWGGYPDGGAYSSPLDQSEQAVQGPPQQPDTSSQTGDSGGGTQGGQIGGLQNLISNLAGQTSPTGAMPSAPQPTAPGQPTGPTWFTPQQPYQTGYGSDVPMQPSPAITPRAPSQYQTGTDVARTAYQMPQLSQPPAGDVGATETSPDPSAYAQRAAPAAPAAAPAGTTQAPAQLPLPELPNLAQTDAQAAAAATPSVATTPDTPAPVATPAAPTAQPPGSQAVPATTAPYLTGAGLPAGAGGVGAPTPTTDPTASDPLNVYGGQTPAGAQPVAGQGTPGGGQQGGGFGGQQGGGFGGLNPIKLISDFLFGGPQALIQDLMGMAGQAGFGPGGGMYGNAQTDPQRFGALAPGWAQDPSGRYYQTDQGPAARRPETDQGTAAPQGQPAAPAGRRVDPSQDPYRNRPLAPGYSYDPKTGDYTPTAQGTAAPTSPQSAPDSGKETGTTTAGAPIGSEDPITHGIVTANAPANAGTATDGTSSDNGPAEAGRQGSPGHANYFQRQHGFNLASAPPASAMTRITTPFGPVTVNPMAARDVGGFFSDLQRQGAPTGPGGLQKLGSYNHRPMAYNKRLASSHAWGAAFDMNDKDGPIAPRMRQWINQNPQRWHDTLRRWNMTQPLPGKDPNHLEWTGPGAGGTRVAQGAGTRAVQAARGGRGTQTAAAGPSAAGARGQAAVTPIVTNALRQGGLNNNAIQGILYNINAESSFDPSLRHPDHPGVPGEAGYAHGLYQEGTDEWNKYSRWLRGRDWRDPQLQTQFLVENLRTSPEYRGLWNRLQNAQSPEQAASDFASMYLRPSRANLAKRLADIRAGGTRRFALPNQTANQTQTARAQPLLAPTQNPSDPLGPPVYLPNREPGQPPMFRPPRGNRFQDLPRSPNIEDRRNETRQQRTARPPSPEELRQQLEYERRVQQATPMGLPPVDPLESLIGAGAQGAGV